MKKNYIKLIGSVILTLSMIVIVGLATIKSEATEETRLWLSEYESDAQGVPTKDGYVFGGYYVKNADTGAYEAIASKDGVDEYYAKFVPKAVLSVKAQVSGNILEDDETDDISETNKNMIRFLTTIDDSLDYQKVGFHITIGDYYDKYVDEDVYVYSHVYAVGATEATAEKYDPSIFDDASAYFKAYTFTEVPADYFNTDITVTPYWVTKDGTRVEGTTGIKTVNLGRSWIYVDSTSTSEDELGTLNAPYKTMAKAVEHDTTLPLKVTLKSDVTVSETINIGEGKNITITDDGTERTIIRGAKNFDMIDVKTGATLTLSSTGAVGDYKLILDGNKNNYAAGSAKAATIIRLQEKVSATVNIYSGVKLQNNASGKGGGGIAVESTESIINVNGACFVGISASGYNGGVIYLQGGSCTIENSMFSECNTDKVGGAIFVQSDAQCDIEDTKFDACEALQGAAIYSKGILSLVGKSKDKAAISNCSCSTYHSAIYLKGGTFSGGGYGFTQKTDDTDNIFVGGSAKTESYDYSK